MIASINKSMRSDFSTLKNSFQNAKSCCCDKAKQPGIVSSITLSRFSQSHFVQSHPLNPRLLSNMLTTLRALKQSTKQVRSLSTLGPDAGDIIGIDLGTTNSCVSVMEGKESANSFF
mgnify:CR=1 FL=1